MDRDRLASMIDHTLLSPEATPDRIAALCDEGIAMGVAAVCLHPRSVPLAVGHLATAEAPPPVAAVVGFPSGAHRSAVKAAEAEQAVSDGAGELDMVVPLGSVLAADWNDVAADIGSVRAAAPGAVLKIIVESALLDRAALHQVCRVAADGGADLVKTSTGFHPAGGATIDAVVAMRAAVGPDVGVKASGGIRDAGTALAMIDAGATRLGASSTAAILSGLG